ncbi:MAG: DUF2442 domain-containing protein [Candidatus Kapaibacteriota bacterium]|jgi:hypothetical protein
MTILEDQTDYTTEVEPLSIIRAEYLGEYKLHLWFIDGKNHSIDFAPFLLNARNPMTVKYRDRNLFQAFTIEHGNLHWNNYDLCFETALLYRITVVEYNGFG